jgi:hypothetical protein
MIVLVHESIITVRKKSDPLIRSLYLAFTASFMAWIIAGIGTIGMPFNANTIACISLGMALRAKQLLSTELLLGA